MKSGIDYKQKYFALRDQMIKAIDFAFRQGFEAAMKEAQIQQAQMQSQMQAQMAQQMQSQNIGLNQDARNELEQSPEEQLHNDQAEQQVGEPEDGSQLDQHIKELEEAISKSSPEVAEKLAKSLSGIKGYSKKWSLTKEKSPFKMSKTASKVLSPEQKVQLSIQEKILNDVLEKWEKEGQQTIATIQSSLNSVLKKHQHE